jgi:hypothetical protein
MGGKIGGFVITTALQNYALIRQADTSEMF